MNRVHTLFLALTLTTAAPLYAEDIAPATTTMATTPAAALPVEQTGTIIIRITDLKKNIGLLGVSLYNNKKGFPGDHNTACATALKKVTGDKDEVVFHNMPYGTYAISVLHDENSNGKLDTRFLIPIPKEGIGVSNNPKPRRGAPLYNECMFTLDAKQLETTIAMRYY